MRAAAIAVVLFSVFACNKVEPAKLQPLVAAQPVSATVEAAVLGKLVIVVDDVGYRMDRLRELLKIPLDLTIAVLPDTPYDQRSAELARAAGRQVIVHMPMEPEDYPKVDPGPCALTRSMTGSEIKTTLKRCLEMVPGAVGMNNHMGSSFTRDKTSMAHVGDYLAQTHWFFLDSLTTPDSVAAEVISARNIPTGRRDFFADHDRNRKQIESQFMKAIALAKKRGHAILICHPYAVTIYVLQKLFNKSVFAKVQVVPAGDLIASAQTRIQE